MHGMNTWHVHKSIAFARIQTNVGLIRHLSKHGIHYKINFCPILYNMLKRIILVQD